MVPKPAVHERDLLDFAKSDPEDSDFDDPPENRRTSRNKRSKKKRKSGERSKGRSSNRRRERYDDDSDDIVSDSEDDISEDSFISQDDDDDDDPVELSKSGRPTRRAVKTNAVNYAESEASGSDQDDAKPSLLVTLNLPVEVLQEEQDRIELQPRRKTRARTSRSQSAQVPARATRRSARLTTEEPDVDVELTPRGNHVRPAGKKPAKQPSMIQEEESQLEDNLENDHAPGTLFESIENKEDADADVMEVEADDDDDEDDDDIPVRRKTRGQVVTEKTVTPAASLPKSTSQKRKRSGTDDYDPEDEIGSDDADNLDTPAQKKKRTSSDSEDDGHSDDESLDADEMAEELEELEPRNRRRRKMRRIHSDNGILYDDQPSRSLRRRDQRPNYDLFPQAILDIDQQSDDGKPAKQTPNARAGFRSLFNTGGGANPFGLNPNAAVLGDDSSDDEPPPKAAGVPMTPQVPQPFNFDQQAVLGRSGKSKPADITPVGVSTDINLESVGGLDDHINKLKEMIMLPLMYPSLYDKWKMNPPRGVLFHGPPGTGKTLLARALASQLSSDGRKVTFYMRKGADVMSKWVGEAERQLRLLFEEAKKNSPAILFFDEFDGLAPVRSNKQDQIHSSIVTTLLALMDGMDNRGEIVIIAATNRPDSIDPAFRRPGRFDREFYFPLPNLSGRRAILDIHTKSWDPPISDSFKDQMAELTKGFGGSDLKALTNETVINAVQRTYPQIYRSNKKLEVDPNTVKVIPADFMLALRKINPSSARVTGALAEPLPKKLQPLLEDQFIEIVKRVEKVMPQKKHLTALEEAEFYDPDDADSFGYEMTRRAFELGRVFRPRLLITGPRGMGQKYLYTALLNKLENVFVRNLDLGTLFSDPTNSPEAVIRAAFKEAHAHQPSVILIPEVNVWYGTVTDSVLQTFSTEIRSLSANESVLLLGVMETDADEKPDPRMLKDLFGFSSKHEYQIHPLSDESRFNFFEPMVSFAKKKPSEFPDRENQKKRKLPELPVAKEEPKVQKEPTKDELKAQAKADRSVINLLRIYLNPLLENAKVKYRGFRSSAIQDREIEYLYREQDNDILVSDLTDDQRALRDASRPYEISKDKHGNPGLIQTLTGKFFYNCNLQVIESRLTNGYYKRPKEFLFDLKTIAKDWSQLGHRDNMTKAGTMYGNILGEVELLEMQQKDFFASCEAVYEREQKRQKMQLAQAKDGNNPTTVPNIPPPAPSTTINTGPIQLLGIDIPTNNLNKDIVVVNGDSIPSHINGVLNNVGISDLSSGNRPQFPAGYTVTPSNPTTQDHSNPDGQKQDHGDVDNSITTTTSGDKTTRTSDSSINQFTQSQPEMFQRQHPDWSTLYPQPNTDASPLPDTYPNSENTHSALHIASNRNSSGDHSGSGGSQPFPKPQMTAREMQQTTNTQGTHGTPAPSSQAVEISSVAVEMTEAPPPSPPAPPPPPFILDEAELENLRSWIVKSTKGFTVDQLEMIDARCMAAIWKCKALWDRSHMLIEIRQAVDEVLEDIEWQKRLIPVEPQEA